MQKKVLLFAFLLLCYPIVNAQSTFRIKVSDYYTGKTLEGAHLRSLPDSLLLGYASVNGIISWDYSPTHTKQLILSAIGYQPIILPISLFHTDSILYNFYLIPTENLLETMVITASKSSESMREVTVSMESVKPYVAENKNIVQPQQLANQIPGVSVVDGQANIRSGSGWSYGTGSRVMVLVDGMPMMSGDAGQVLWNFIPIEDLSNTEVIKGASSVLFGSSALNGIIHFRTHDAGPKPRLGFTSYIGTYQIPTPLRWDNTHRGLQYGTTGFYSQRLGRWEHKINMNFVEDKGYRMGEFDNRKKMGYHLKYVHSPSLQLGLKTAVMQRESGAFLLWQSLDSAYTALNRETTLTKAKNFHVDPYIIFRKGKNTHKIQSRYLLIQNEVDNGNPAIDQSNQSGFLWSEYTLHHQDTAHQVDWTAGLMASNTQSRSPLFSGSQKAFNTAAFFQLSKKWGKWNLSGGMRYEYFQLNDRADAKPIFRAGVNYALTKATYLRSSWGQGFRFPTIAESYISTAVGPVFVYPNPSLEAETGQTMELGVKQLWKWKKMKGFIDIALFNQRYYNMTEFIFGQWFMPRPNDPLGVGFKSVNVGNTSIKGIELSFAGDKKLPNNGHFRFFGGLLLSVPTTLEPDWVFAITEYGDSFSYNTTASNPEKGVLKYRSANQFKIDLEHQWKKKWMYGVSLRYTSPLENIDKAFVSFPLTLFITGIEQGRLLGAKGLTYTDLRVGYNVSERFKIQCIVNNVFNRVYMLRPADMQPPRLLLLQLRYAFH